MTIGHIVLKKLLLYKTTEWKDYGLGVGGGEKVGIEHTAAEEIL